MRGGERFVASVLPRLRASAALALLLPFSALAAPATPRWSDHDLTERALLIQAEDERDARSPVLARAASSESPALRARAARAMGRIGDDLSSRPLSRLLVDPVSRVRHEAAFALGELGAPGAFGTLAHALESEDEELAVLAAEALAKLRWPDEGARARAGGLVVRRFLAETSAGRASPEALQRVLHDASAFGGGVPGATEAVRRLAGRTDVAREVSEAALHCAARLRDPRLADALLLGLRHGPSPRARAHAARGLGALASEAGARDQEPPEAWRSALVRAAMDDRSFVLPELSGGRRGSPVTFSEVPPDVVRIAALRSLAAFEPPEPEARAAAPVLRALRTGNPAVQLEALGLAQSWRTPAVAPALKAILAGPERLDLQEAALAAWSALGGIRALPALRDAAESPDWRRRAAAAAALDAKPLARAIDGRLLQDRLLLDRDPRVVAIALAAVAESGRGDASVLVLGQLASADVVVRAVAIDLLASLGETDVSSAEAAAAVRGALRAAHADADPDARIAAIESLSRLLGRGCAPDIELALQDPAYTVRLRAREVARALDLHALAARPVGPVGTGLSLAAYRESARRERAGETATLTLITERGILDLDLFPTEAPLTVEHLLRLADAGFFDGLSFHRVVPDFVVQGGDPRGDGWGGPGTSIRCEINRRRYERGSAGMALAGKDTGGSQLFFTLSPQPHLDGGYTLFGRLRPGSWPVLDALRRHDRILAAIPGPAGARESGRNR